MMSEIAKEYPNVSFSPNIFTPYPGIPIWPQLKEMGVREPQTLEEWEILALGPNVLPWLRGEELRRLRRSLEYFLLNNQIRKVTKKMPWAGAGCAAASGSACPLADWQEQLFVSVGIVGVARGGESRDEAVTCLLVGFGRTHARGLLNEINS